MCEPQSHRDAISLDCASDCSRSRQVRATLTTTSDWARVFRPAKDQASKVSAADLKRLFGQSAIKKEAGNVRKHVRNARYTPDEEDA